MELADVDALLARLPLSLETGWERLPDGVLHVAARTDMHGCSGDMLEWWFRWRCDTQKYIWWHPIDHVSSAWAGNDDPSTHVGAEHIVVERLTELPEAELVIQFRDPLELFDGDAYAEAREGGSVSCAVVGRIGFGHQPHRDADGAVLGGRLAHVGRDTEWGMALRSHFFLGQDLAAAGMAPEDVTANAPDLLAPQLLQHTYNEFTFLARFLPALHAAEHRDQRPPAAPW